MTELWRKPATDLAQLVRIGAASATEITQDALARLDAVNPAINAVVQFMPEQAMASGEGNRRGSCPRRPAAATGRRAGDGQGQCRPGRLCHHQWPAHPERPRGSSKTAPWSQTCARQVPSSSGAPMRQPSRCTGFAETRCTATRRTLSTRRITPGGSSGGAAAATAAGIGAIGHGTDIAGSIRYPAYACGLHGLRPTLGRVPAVNFSGPDRHIGAQLMAVSGPLARTIADVQGRL
jgi:amidase